MEKTLSDHNVAEIDTHYLKQYLFLYLDIAICLEISHSMSKKPFIS